MVTYGLSAVLKRQIDAGEPFDIAVLTPPLIDDLIKQGKIAGGTRVTLARSGMALAIRAGAARPDIRTTDALKRTLLASTSISYAREGASGVFFTELLPQLSQVTDKMTLIRSVSYTPVGIILNVTPHINLPVRGIEVLGTFPADVQGYVVMVAGVSPGTAQSAAAKELITFLIAPSALPVIKKRGMERD